MMDHKAFLFDWKAFDKELRPILYEALESNSTRALADYVAANFEDLTDPYEGQPLAFNWCAHTEQGDPHKLGDLALTRYYNPADDIGLGSDWQEAQSVVSMKWPLATWPMLGNPLGPRDRPFDPGRMGSYFQDQDIVERNLKLTTELFSPIENRLISRLIDMLSVAEVAKKGLYITF